MALTTSAVARTRALAAHLRVRPFVGCATIRRMKTARTVIAVVFFSTPLLADDITTNFRSFWVSPDGNHVVIEGTWHRLEGKTGSQVPTVNSVRIECSRSQGVCREYVARLIDPKDDPMAPGKMLLLSLNEFTIQGWDARGIVAKSAPPVADWFLRISLASKIAERDSQETEARGAKGARRTPDRWVLR